MSLRDSAALERLRGQAFAYTLKVEGYQEFARALNAVPNEIKRDVREALRTSGERVQKGSTLKTASELGSLRSAYGYRTYVRTRGVSVEQSLRKTTGRRSDWGVTQMRESLVPTLVESEPFIVRDFEAAAQEIVDFFELRARWVAAGFLPA